MLILRIVVLLVAAASPAAAQLIPSSRLATANWQTAGMQAEGGIPARATVCATVNASTYGNGARDATAGIQAAIRGCATGQTVALSAGLFRLDSYLYVNRSITLRGAGAGVTTLRNVTGAVRDNASLDNANGNDTGLIIVGVSQWPHFLNTGTLNLTANAVQGASSVTLASVKGLSVGQYVLVSEDHFNTAAWMSKPLSGGSANAYQVWASDRVVWAKHRNIAAAAVTSLTFDATTDRVTTNVAHGLMAGHSIYIGGHTAMVRPAASDHVYRVRDIISPTVFTMQPASWDKTLIDITAGGSGTAIEANRPGDNLNPGPAHPTDSALGWFARGYGHVYGDIKRITGIAGLTVTFESPFSDTFRTAYGAQVSVSDTAFVEYAGVEDMTLHRGARGALSFLNAAKSWAKNVEVYEYYDPGIQLTQSYRIEIAHSLVRHAAWLFPGGGSYAIRFANQTSDSLVWDSIFVDSNKNIAANATGGGNVFAYNHTDDSVIFNYPTWQEVGINGGHFPGSHHMLFEGNYSPNADNDFTHGSAIRHTFARNWLSGQRASYTDTDNTRVIGLAYGSLDMSFVGNVLGREGLMDGWTLDAGSAFAGTTRHVYKIGYDPVEWPQAADTATVSSLIDKDNYNYLTPGIRTSASPDSVPKSLFLSAAPALMGTCTWPWVQPTSGTKLYTLPARSRYLAGESMSTADQCSAPPLNAAPVRLRRWGE